MFSSSESVLVNRDRKHVYSVAETYPQFARFFRFGEILKQNDHEMIVKIGSTICGLHTSWVGHGKKIKFESIEFVQTEGLLKGLVAVWKFQDHDKSTEVTISSSFNLKVPLAGEPLEWLLGTFKVRKTVRMILEALKKEAESPI